MRDHLLKAGHDYGQYMRDARNAGREDSTRAKKCHDFLAELSGSEESGPALTRPVEAVCTLFRRSDRTSSTGREVGRLHARWVTFTERRKRPVVANVAIARELAGWCSSLAVMDE